MASLAKSLGAASRAVPSSRPIGRVTRIHARCCGDRVPSDSSWTTCSHTRPRLVWWSDNCGFPSPHQHTHLVSTRVVPRWWNPHRDGCKEHRASRCPQGCPQLCTNVRQSPSNPPRVQRSGAAAVARFPLAHNRRGTLTSVAACHKSSSGQVSPGGSRIAERHGRVPPIW